MMNNSSEQSSKTSVQWKSVTSDTLPHHSVNDVVRVQQNGFWRVAFRTDDKHIFRGFSHLHMHQIQADSS